MTIEQVLDALRNSPNYANLWSRRLADAIDAHLASQPAEQPMGEDWPLRGRVWDRRGEWVLELEGTIDDTAMYVRHTEPMTTARADVPGLPSLYDAQPKPEQAVGDGVDQAEFKRGYDHAVQHMADIWMDPAVRELRVVAVDMRHYLTRIGETMNSAMREKWGDTIEQADKRVSSALAGLREAIATPRPAVATPADTLGDSLRKLVAEASEYEWSSQFFTIEVIKLVDSMPVATSPAPAEVTDEMVERFKVAARALVRERKVYAEDVETMHGVLRLLESLTAQCQVRKDGQGVEGSERLAPLAPASDAVIAAADIYERERNSGATHDQALGVALSGVASPSAGAVVPEGWKLVPKKLDENMRKAFELAKQWTTSDSAIFTDGDVDHIYSGLLAAAPEVPRA